MKINKELHPDETKNIISRVKACAPQEDDAWRNEILVNKIMTGIEEVKIKKSVFSPLRKRLLVYASSAFILAAGLVVYRNADTGNGEKLIAGNRFLSKEFCVLMENMNEFSEYKQIREMEVLLSMVD